MIAQAIEYSDALSVAHVHSVVTNQTWNEIMKYEGFHFNKCKQPKLARFEGKDGFYSPKARFFNKFFQFRNYKCLILYYIIYFIFF